MNRDTIQQFVRIAAHWGGTALATYGYLDDSMVETVIGLAVNGTSLIWWLVWERKRVRK